MEDWVEPCQGAVREACLLMDIGRLLSRKWNYNIGSVSYIILRMSRLLIAVTMHIMTWNGFFHWFAKFFLVSSDQLFANNATSYCWSVI